MIRTLASVFLLALSFSAAADNFAGDRCSDLISYHDPMAIVRDGVGNQRYAQVAGYFTSNNPFPAFGNGGDGITSLNLPRLFTDQEAGALIFHLETFRQRGMLPTAAPSINIFDPNLAAFVGLDISARLLNYAQGMLNHVQSQIPPFEAARLAIEPTQTFVRWTTNAKVPNDQLHLDDGTAFTVLKREFNPRAVPGTRIRSGDFLFIADTTQTLIFNGNQRPVFYGYPMPPSNTVSYDDFLRMSIPTGIRPVVHAAGESSYPVTDLLVVVGLTYRQ